MERGGRNQVEGLEASWWQSAGDLELWFDGAKTAGPGAEMTRWGLTGWLKQ